MAGQDSRETTSPLAGWTSPRQLPSYLLGGPTSPSFSELGSRNISGGATGHWPLETTKQRDLPAKSKSLSKAKLKPGPPPVAELYDSPCSLHQSTPASLETNQPSFTPSTIHGLQSRSVSSPYANSPGLFSGESISAQSPAQLDPFYQYGDTLKADDSLDDCWVTVYGFPSTAASYILQEFSNFGTILKHVISSNGNWMHLKYQSRFQAIKALSKNGKIFGNSIMIGVRPCLDKAIMEASAVESMSVQEPNRIGGMRPLVPASAYQAKASLHDVVPKEPTMPRKYEGFVAKIMDLIGW